MIKMLSKLKLSILVNFLGRGIATTAGPCVQTEACIYTNAPNLTSSALDDVLYADATMTRILSTSAFQISNNCCADTTSWFTTPARSNTQFYEKNQAAIAKTKFNFYVQWDEAPYEPYLVVLTHINEVSGLIYGSEHFMLVYRPYEGSYSANDLQDIKSQRITAFCQTMKDGWILESNPSNSLVGTFNFGTTTVNHYWLNDLQSDKVVVGGLSLCPYVLKMTSPESLTIETSSNFAFYTSPQRHAVYVSKSVPYTLANGQPYFGDVTFDLCSGDDGTCVPIFTLSYLNCMGIAINIADSDQSMTVKFPTFNQFFQWNQFSFSEQTASCQVNAYYLQLTDPNGIISEVKIERPDNGSDFAIVEGNQLGYGQYFTLDPNSLKISFNSDSFTDSSKLIYLGSYKIEVWGGLTWDLIQSQSKLTYTLDISSECFDAVNTVTITNTPLGFLKDKCAGNNSEFSVDLSLRSYPKSFKINEGAVQHDEDMCGTIQYSIESTDDSSVQLTTSNVNKALRWPSSLTNPFYKRVSSVIVKAEQVGYSFDTYSFTFTQIVCSVRFEHEDYSGQKSDFIFPLNALNSKLFSINKDPLTPNECEDDIRAKIYLNDPRSETSIQEIDNILFASKFNDTSFTVDVSGFSFDELKELNGNYRGGFAREETWGCQVRAETDFSFNLYMCWITEPSPIFVDTSEIQYEIDISDLFVNSLSVQINPFTMNFIQCGGLQYGLAATNQAWDAFQEGVATFDQVDTFIFTDIRSYPTGNLTVTIKAWLDCVDDIYLATPVEIEFVIQVVDNTPQTSELIFVSESSIEEETIKEVVITNQKDQDSEESQQEQDDSNSYKSQLTEAVGAIYAELLDRKKKLEQDNLKQQSQFEPLEPPRVSLISIDQAGIVEINFTKSMYVNEAIKTMNSDGMRVTLKDMSRMMQQEEWNIEPVININMIPSDDTEPESIEITSWKVKEFTEDKLSIKVEFYDPLSLSVNTVSDEIEVKFVSDFDNFFFDENTGKNLNLNLEENLIEKVPKQYPDEDTKKVYDSISAVTGNVSGGLVVTNFALTIFLSAVLQQLWQLIEAQQLIILLPLTNTNCPPNAMAIFQLLMQIAAFDLLPTDYFYEDVLKVDVEGQPVNQNFETGGFEHHLIINNLGSIGVFIAILPFQYLMYYATISLRNSCRCCKIVAKRLKKSLFWGILIRFILESYTIGFICCLLNAQKIDFSSGNYWITLNSVLTILFTIVYSVFPIISAGYMYSKFNQLGDAQLQVRYGELYAGYNHRERSMIIYWTVEYLRRALICLTLVLTQQLFCLQMTTIFYTSTMMLIAQNYTRARLSKCDLVMDIFNELKFIWIMYHVMLFSQTNLVINSETQFMIGHSCAASLIIGTFVNFYVLVSVAGKQCRKKSRICLHKRKAKRLLSKKSKKAAKGFQERRLVSQKEEQKRLEQQEELERMIVIQQLHDAFEQQIQNQKDQEQEKIEIEQTEQQQKLLQHYLNLRQQRINMQIQQETPNSNSSDNSQDIESEKFYYGSNIEEEKKAPSRINTNYRVEAKQKNLTRNYREEIVNHEDVLEVSNNNTNYDQPKLLRAHQNEPFTMQDKGQFRKTSSQQQKGKQAFTNLERDVIQMLQQPLRNQQQEQLVTLAEIGAVENHDDLEEEFDAYLNGFQLVTNNKQNRVAPNEHNEQEQQKMNEEQVVKRRPNIVIGSKDSYWPNE